MTWTYSLWKKSDPKRGLARELLRGAPRQSPREAKTRLGHNDSVGGVAAISHFRTGTKWASISDSSEQDYPRSFCVSPTSFRRHTRSGGSKRGASPNGTVGQHPSRQSFGTARRIRRFRKPLGLNP